MDNQLESNTNIGSNQFSWGTFFTKFAASIAAGGYLGAIIVGGEFILLLIAIVISMFYSSGLGGIIIGVVIIGVVLGLGGWILIYVTSIAGAIIGGAISIIPSIICSVIYLMSDKDNDGGVSNEIKVIMALIGSVSYFIASIYINRMTWLVYDEFSWMAVVNTIAFTLGGAMSGFLGEPDKVDDESANSEAGDFDLMAPFKFYRNVGNVFTSTAGVAGDVIEDVSYGTSKKVIKQDGKTYRRGLGGNWVADKDWLGNDKVERNAFGSPKVEKNILGQQKVERGFSGKPIIPPENE